MVARRLPIAFITVCAFVLVISGCSGSGTSSSDADGSGGGQRTGPEYLTLNMSGTGTLAVSVAGGGRVHNVGGDFGEIECTGDMPGYAGACSHVYATGSSVKLMAMPDVGYTFTGWYQPMLVGADTAQYVTAVFAPDAATRVTQLYTDIASGPTTGGESNKGAYLSVFGYGFGSTGMGTTVKVYLDNIEVDNYRYLGASHGRNDVQQITVQLGALGGAVNGAALPVKVVVGGNVARDPNALTFMVNPGTIYFVDNVVGDDSTGAPGDITLPYRTVQKATINNNTSSGTPCTIAAGIETVSVAGVWGLVRPGDFIVLRGGAWTDISKDGYFLRAQNKFGTEPAGVVDSGPITVMGYSNETVSIDRVNTAGSGSGGGIASADSVRQGIGCGQWVTLANLKIESGFNDGVISTQAGYSNPNGSYWRVVNNEVTASSCQVNELCGGGAVSGSGVGNFWVGNHIHDVYDKPDGVTDDENHGYYVNGPGSYEIAYNRIEGIYGGDGIQTYSVSGAGIDNVGVHHNAIGVTGRYGLNIADKSSAGFVFYNNIIYNTGAAGIRFGSTDLTNMLIYNNTFFNIGGLSHAALVNDSAFPDAAVDFRNNIVVPATGAGYLGGSAQANFSNPVQFSASNNLWFGGVGMIVGNANVTGDPKFESTVSGSENLQLQADSPALTAGTDTVSATVVDDFMFVVRPNGSNGYGIGAFDR